MKEIAELAAAILKRKPARIVSLIDYNALLKDSRRLAETVLAQQEKNDG